MKFKTFALAAIGFSISTLFVGQACTPSFQANSTLSSSSSENDLSVPIDNGNQTRAHGTKLYATHCAGCHGDLSASVKLDRSAAQISAARLSVAVMNTAVLKGLSDADLEAIAVALRTTSAVGSNPFTCDPKAKPGAARLQRLAKSEYQNTLRDLFSAAMNISEISTELAQIPEEVNSDNPFDRGADSLNLGHIKAHNAVSAKIAQLVTSNTTKLNSIFTETCFTQNPVTDTCINSFIDRFGLKVYRRPVKSTERAPLLAAYRIGADRTESSGLLLRALLMSPNFIYHVEYDGTPIDSEVTALTLNSYELASRLSYLVINSMPDQALFDAAANNSILSASGYLNQMNRLLAMPAAKTSLRRFFHKWFELERIHDATYSTAFRKGINTTGLNAAAIEEAMLFTDYVVFSGKKLEDLLTDSTAFVKSQALADIYGISLPSAADGRTVLPQNERAGLLTRAARTLSGSDSTSPIERGIAVRRSLLCDTLQAPNPASLPPGALDPPPDDPLLSTRQRFENKTSGAACTGCHSKINPVGYALEGFDGLGRYRRTESIINSAGQVVAQHPVDDISTVDLASPPNPKVRGGVELSHAVAESQKFSACFSQRWFQFSMRRSAKTPDSCSLAATYEVLKSPSATLLDVIKADATSQEFKIRRMK